MPARGLRIAELLERDLDAATLRGAAAPGGSGSAAALLEAHLAVPAREFLRRPGKKFRGRVVELSWALARGDEAGPPAVLPLFIELLHAGSLIVDDFADGAEIRRGALALHQVYGAPLALNTANWMYFWAFELLREAGLGPEVELSLYRRACLALVRCHQGQALDLGTRVYDLAQGDVADVVATATRLKTGSLMELAALAGSIAAGAGADLNATMERFGGELGLALQMLDDQGAILDDRRRAKAEEDLKQARATWPWAWMAADLSESSFSDMQRTAAEVALGGGADRLIRKMRGALGATTRRRVHSRLQRATAELEASLGEEIHPRVLTLLIHEIDRLERSYG